MLSCDHRLLGFIALILISFVIAMHRNCFRFTFVHVWSSMNPLKQDRNNSKPPCSFEVFRQYLRETKSSYLPGDGVWKRRAGNLVRFEPALCTLSYGSWIPRDLLASCFTRLNISYVVILGDSNALRLHKEIRRTLSAVGSLSTFNCDRALHVKPALPAHHCSPNYLPLRRFLPPNYFRCKIGSVNAPLLVQYLPVTGELMPLDMIMNHSATGCFDAKTRRFVQTQATTIQEFLFGEYFATTPHPDIVLYFSSSWEQSSLPVYSDIVDHFVRLLRRHRSQLPSSTRLIVVSRPDEFVPLKPEYWKSRRYEPGNLSRNEWIEASNRILHARLTPLFVDKEFEGGPQLSLFPDISAAMRPVLDDLAVDGVHSNPFWYRTLWSYIVQTVCSADM